MNKLSLDMWDRFKRHAENAGVNIPKTYKLRSLNIYPINSIRSELDELWAESFEIHFESQEKIRREKVINQFKILTQDVF